MTFIFYDTETTGLETAFDQILQFAAIKTDDDLSELDRFDIRSRLMPHIVPSPGALRVTGVNHVWSYDFVMDRTHDGRAFRMLTVIDEFTRECLAIPVAAVLQADRITQSASSLRVAISLAVSRLSSASDPSSGGVSTKVGSATPFNSPVTRMAW